MVMRIANAFSINSLKQGFVHLLREFPVCL